MNKLIALVAAALVSLSYVRVTGADFSVRRQAPIKVGALLMLSGSFAGAGDDTRRGIEAALRFANKSRALEVLYADSRNEPPVAIGEFHRLVSLFSRMNRTFVLSLLGL